MMDAVYFLVIGLVGLGFIMLLYSMLVVRPELEEKQRIEAEVALVAWEAREAAWEEEEEKVRAQEEKHERLYTTTHCPQCGRHLRPGWTGTCPGCGF